MTPALIQPIEHREQRVVTTKQLADFYGVKPIIIQQNFSNNREKYEERVDFFTVKRGEECYSKFSNSIKSNQPFYLWTEYGALLHAKSLNSEKAWTVFKQLREVYFRVQALSESLPPAFEAFVNKKIEAVRQEVLGDVIEELFELEKVLMGIVQPEVLQLRIILQETAIHLNRRIDHLAQCIPTTRPENYFTIREFARKVDMALELGAIQQYGKRCTALSLQKNVDVLALPVLGANYGKVNLYREDILLEVFAENVP